MNTFVKAPDFSQTQLEALCAYRLQRIRNQMQAHDIALCILSNPVSLRYAVDFDEYLLFQSHIPTSYLFLPLSGPLVLHGATRTSFPGVTEYRRPDFITPFDGGLELRGRCEAFADAVMNHLKENSLWERQCIVALDRLSPLITKVLLESDIRVQDAESIVEAARSIKSPTEIACIKHSLAVAELGLQKMREATKPGITENQLWSILHQVNIAHDGQWIDGRMLSSGHRTNPWLQEASSKIIQSGEMVATDTDMIGPMGYCADISRSWLCGSKPTPEQLDAYRHAFDEVHHNMDLIKPGVSFIRLSEQAFSRKPEYRANHYPCAFHGVGLSDEYPKIYYEEDWERDGYDGVLEENMVLSVESYSGADGAREGVKLEEMVRVTNTGYELLSSFPFEENLNG